jgi:hypothetical protein
MASHFAGKDPLAHMMEKRKEGMISLTEVHGTEMPGHLSAGTDASKETAIALLLVWIIFSLLNLPFHAMMLGMVAFGLGWVAWKGGRSGRLGWSRLERLHRLIEQEKFEIEHHRPQEREELHALYRAKGFEGKLLEEVVDVLMADQDRLLKVMLEEEMGLTLEAYEHPLQQALGALIGACSSLVVCLIFNFFLPQFGMWIAVALLLIAASTFSALYKKNKPITEVIWYLSIGALAVGFTYFLFEILS